LSTIITTQQDVILLGKSAFSLRNSKTSLDLGLQKVAQNSLKKHIRTLAIHRVTQGAAVVINNPTGEVLALVESSGFSDSPTGQVNGAWSPRSPGSSLKPFTYTLALDSGISPATPLPDVPAVFEQLRGPLKLQILTVNFVGQSS
jgi:penicillin-binding protein 1C